MDYKEYLASHSYLISNLIRLVMARTQSKYLAAITWNKISDTLRSLIILSAFNKEVRQLRFWLILIIKIQLEVYYQCCVLIG